MKRLFFLIWLFVIGCSNTMMSEDCDCSFEISSDLPKFNGVYEIEYNQDLAQTYSVLSCTTECGVNQHIQWDSDWQIQISDEWTSLVNPASMTDEDGNGKIVFAVWEEFIGETITIYGTYTDDCGNNFLNSVKVKVVDNE